MSDGDTAHDTEPAAGDVQDHGVPAHDELEAAWLGMLHQLTFYRIQHGHCFVPRRDRHHPQLAAWLAQQVMHFHKGILPKDKQRELEALGMEWDADDPKPAPRHWAEARWESRFEELVAFKKKHGHLGITKTNEPFAGLSHWRDNQRLRLRGGTMKPEQKARLDDLGFAWETPDRLSPSMERHNVELWESMFAKLRAFRELHGHCQVPMSEAADSVLAKWVQRQRHHHRNNALLPERRKRLEEIGFAWRSDRLHFAEGWEGRFAELVAFKEKHGHLGITKTNEPSAGLSHWRDNQRLRLRSGTMKPEQKARLDDLGFAWETPTRHAAAPREAHRESQWQGKYQQMVSFKGAHGHSRVPRNWRENLALGKWLQKQRGKFRNGSGAGGLLPERLAMLDALGTEWRETPPRGQSSAATRQDLKAKWESRYARLVEFHRLNGHANVPGRPDRLLRNWVLEQREKRGEGSLDEEQIARLEALGFAWETPHRRSASSRPPRNQRSSIWDQRFEELQAFVAAHGHFRVPKKQDELKTLRHWVVEQRRYQRRGTMLPAHREKLAAIGFPWDPGKERERGRGSEAGGRNQAKRWNDHFCDLGAFKERHGHTRVQHHRGPDMKLGSWLVRQRHLRRLGQLAPDRIQRLESLGVDWGAPTSVTRGGWDLRMAELREFHAQHGHANVPTKYPPNRLLGNWVSNTRILYKAGKLGAECIQELEALGFRWRGERNNPSRLDASWEATFAALLEFREVHGHANVLRTSQSYPALADWVSSQRLKHRRGVLQEDRVRKLEAIGFRWGKQTYQAGLQKSWDQRFAELVAFRRQHGHPHVSKADKAHRSLEIWAKTQRVLYHQGKLSADRIQRLESIGFTWDGNEGWWERQFRRWEGATQRRRTRHITVIGDADDDLARWEQIQRTLHRQGKLSPEKASLLTRAGLIFEAPRAPKSPRTRLEDAPTRKRETEPASESSLKREARELSPG